MGALTRQQENALADTKQYLFVSMKSFEAALPPHIKPERFLRTVLTALMIKPELLGAPPEILLVECLKCAADGLLPDGKEAALVPRFGREFSLAYQPMIAGIRKKARNSGEISSWDAYVVKENDHFDFGLGFDPYVKHTYDIQKERGKTIAFYSVCTLKDGTKSLDVMSTFDVNRIRDRSDAYKAFVAKKIKSTPWDSDYDQMGLKTVGRRHSKVLPTSSDLDRLLYQGDDEIKTIDYGDLSAATNGTKAAATLAGRLDQLTNEPDADDGKTIDGDQGGQQGSSGNQQQEDGNGTPSERDLADAREAGAADAKAGKAKRAMPAKYRNDDALAEAYGKAFDNNAQQDR